VAEVRPGALNVGALPAVHWSRATSPLGIALIAAALSLASALWLVRRRSSRSLASIRDKVIARSGSHRRRRRPIISSRGQSSRAARAMHIFRPERRQDLVAVLAPYRLVPLPANPSPEADVWVLLTLPQLKRLSLALEALVERARFGRWLATMLERAGVRTRVGELLTVWLLAGVILVAFGWALAGLIGTVLVLILVLVIPPAAIQGAVDYRARLFASQLPDVLKLTASSLRAGFSLLQGLDAVTKQLQGPSAGELQRVLNEARLGRPVEDALEAAAGRICNRDFSESVAAVRIQQEAGGNLASLFDTLAETMVQRLRLRREVRTLTSEARLSAYILGAMPLLLGLFIFAVNQAYMLELFRTRIGQIMLVGGLLLQVVGFFWMYRTVKIET
jgi:tight adherence protein B